jgi:ribosomal protein L11 methyltransferase
MPKNYIEYSFSVIPSDPWEEILLAQLHSLPFESFENSEGFLKAYVPEDLHYDAFLDSIDLLSNSEVTITFEKKTIEPINWNAKWESEYHPILISENCIVRADFHHTQGKKFELIINPKMSFGTGHHQTTHMMLSFALAEDFIGKHVLDMGCGTGVLAILASLKGAARVDAIDLDPWCIENTIENSQANNCNNIFTFLGEVLSISKPTYNFIFANINRNVLLEQIHSYVSALKPEGVLLLSGFYADDIFNLKECCENEGLSLVEEKQKKSWRALKFIK